MKTKGLSRGEILLGMEQGVFKVGTKFKDVSKSGVGAIARIVCDEACETALYWEKEEQVVQLRNCLTEKWDLIEEPKFEVGDWAVIDGNVCKVTDIHNDDEFIVDKISRLKNQFIPKKYIERKANPEEIAQEKRRRVFAKVGREVDEFKEGDYVEYLGERFQLKYDDLCQEVALKGALTIVMSRSFDKSQLKPIYFVDNMVKEDD
ncbi:hypothetical protein [Bacillus cereus]